MNTSSRHNKSQSGAPWAKSVFFLMHTGEVGDDKHQRCGDGIIALKIARSTRIELLIERRPRIYVTVRSIARNIVWPPTKTTLSAMLLTAERHFRKRERNGSSLGIT